MFEGIYFQFPKLGFLLFFFLACDSLCPLRTFALYFPRTAEFGAVGIKIPLWHWIAKWTMISMLIVTAMSPVREIALPPPEGKYDILLAIDPGSLTPQVKKQLADFMAVRPQDRIGAWIVQENEIIIPLTRDHTAFQSMISQVESGPSQGQADRRIERFFANSEGKIRWVVLISDTPETFVYALPTDLMLDVIRPKQEGEWGGALGISRFNPPIRHTVQFYEFYYVYPLFIAFLAMLAYLYGRNQKGWK